MVYRGEFIRVIKGVSRGLDYGSNTFGPWYMLVSYQLHVCPGALLVCYFLLVQWAEFSHMTKWCQLPDSCLSKEASAAFQGMMQST